MKPNFALQLSNDGAQLLHRAGAHWAPVGVVSFDADDIAAACASLVQAARALAPEGIRTKLVIPASEVRYDQVSAPGPTDEARRYQIEAEIERLTPYVIDELFYDFAVEDDSVLVAICARDTLAEAETFAEGYGFNPVSFVAIPAPGQFSGEPWFGEASVARVHLPAGAHIQRDSEPVRIVAPPVRPTVAGAAGAAATGTAVSGATAQATSRPAAAAQRPVAAPVPPAVAAAGPASIKPVSAPAPVVASVVPQAAPPARVPAAEASEPGDSGLMKVGNLVRRVGNRLRREQAAQITAARKLPQTPVPPALAPPAPTLPAVAAVDPQWAVASAPDAEAAPVAFSTRRQPPQVVATKGRRPEAAGPGPGGRIAVLPGTQPTKSALRSLVRRSQAGARAVLARLGALRPSLGAAKVPAPVVAASRPPMSGKERSREIEALTIFGARGNPVRETNLARRGLLAAGALLMLLVAVAVWSLYFSGNGQTRLADAGSEVATLPAISSPTAVPAANGQSAPLTAPLAAPDPVAPIETVTAVDPATVSAEDPAAVAVASQDPEQLAEDLAAVARDETLPVPSEPATVLAADVAATDPVTEPVTEPAPLSPSPQTATAAAAQPAEPRTSVSAGSEVAEVALSEVPEQRLSLPGPIAAPRVDEVAFEPPPPPPPFGSSFVFDETGLVLATPEGALTPSGVTVFARRPAVAPVPAPGRPAATSVAPAAAAPAALTSAAPADIASAVESALTEAVAASPGTTAGGAPAGTEVVFDDTPRADPALAGARPLAPPARVRALRQQAAPVPAAPAPQDDQTLIQAPEAAETTAIAALETPPPGGVSLASLRPQRRPTDLVPAAESAAPAVTEDLADPDLAGATPEAVAASPIPGARPASIQERARQVLAAASAPAPATAATNDIEDELDEPATTAAAPSIPTTASVARQATETNAINLGEVNLIGVFGTPNDRRALVRLSSGRVVRVAVGDRLDGGQVTAIGESELRYTASGSNQILRIGG